jgi:hypothetical protein
MIKIFHHKKPTNKGKKVEIYKTLTIYSIYIAGYCTMV